MIKSYARMVADNRGDWKVQGFLEVKPKKNDIKYDPTLLPLSFIPLNFPEHYWMVYCVFHDGNTFHHEYEANCMAIGLFSNLSQARACLKKAAQAHKKLDKLKWEDRVVEYDIGDGTTHRWPIQWSGIFTTLSYIAIETVHKIEQAGDNVTRLRWEPYGKDWDKALED